METKYDKDISFMKDVFELMDQLGHEQVIFCRNKQTGLKAIIAIHDTTLGPALGGCRMYPYSSTQEALEDVLRLSYGMTHKCGIVDVDFGGGKMVIIGDPDKDKSPELFRAVGRFVGGLGGRFMTGTDMGTNPEDFIYAIRETRYIQGLPEAYGGLGDTSVPTAYGVYYGIKATAQFLWGSDCLEGRVIAVQGIGKVGSRLVELLVEDKARCIIADTNIEKLNDLKEKYPENTNICEVSEIHRVNCDIFSPCARGGIINDQTISELRCHAIVGSANNQLAEHRHGDQLFEMGILYAPDYLVNAGGLIQVAAEAEGVKNKEFVVAKTKAIYDMLLKIYERSKREQIPTYQAADQIVQERIENVAEIRRISLGLVQEGKGR